MFFLSLKFITQVCGTNYHFSDEELENALELAEEEMWKDLPLQDINYFFSDEDWVERNRIVLRTIGITDNVDEDAQSIQTLWNKIIADNPHRLKPDTKDTLTQLKHRGFSLAISTNWSDPSDTLKSLGIYDFFKSIQYSIVPGFCKPAPYMLVQNACEMSVNPSKCAFVGDDIKRDFPAAKRAGMFPILMVNDDSELPSDDEDLTIIHELNELLKLFE